MDTYPKPIQKLIEEFSRMPGIGPRHAARCIFFLISQKTEELDQFIESLKGIKESIRRCENCFSIFDVERKNSGSENFCPICQNRTRTRDTLCMVENEIAMYALESIGLFRGTYFILGGTISLDGKNHTPQARIGILKERVTSGHVTLKEIIIATDENIAGNATALFIKKELKPLPDIKITRLGRGLPTGGELEYADQETLRNALEGRR